MLTVGLVLYPQMLLSSVTLPIEMLKAADNLHRAQQRSRERLQICVAVIDGQPPHSDDGIHLHPTHALEELEQADLLFLPALWRNPTPVLRSKTALLPLLQQLDASSRFICAVGTGSSFLAEAGLLDGKPGTSHWFDNERFARKYPDVHTKKHHLITQAGHLYCAGSINAVADLTSHFIEHFYNASIARQVDAQFSPEIRRPYRDAGYIAGEINTHQDEVIIDAQEWLQRHFAEDVDFRELAARLNMSQRSLNRRWQLATGHTPGHYLRQLRLGHARELLGNSNLPVADIASNVGYQDLSHFSTQFRKHFAQSPSAYRKSVRGKLFRLQ